MDGYSWVRIVGLVVASVGLAGGCGYLDRDLSLSEAAFEQSFESEAGRGGRVAAGSGASSGGRRLEKIREARPITLGCGLRIYGSGDLTRHRRRKIAIYYDRRCRRADGPLCRLIGARLRGRLPGRLDFSSLRARLASQCRSDDGEACAQLALLYRHGLGGVVDKEAAREARERACKDGVESACPDDEQPE
jgi:hypothetical protein